MSGIYRCRNSQLWKKTQSLKFYMIFTSSHSCSFGNLKFISLVKLLADLVRESAWLAISIYRHNRELGAAWEKTMLWPRWFFFLFSFFFFSSCLHALLSPFPPQCAQHPTGLLSSMQENPLLPTCLCWFSCFPCPFFVFNKHILSLSPLVTPYRMISYYLNQYNVTREHLRVVGVSVC